MPRRGETTGQRHLGHRHGGLLEELAPALSLGHTFMLDTGYWLKSSLVMGDKRFVMDTDQACLIQVFPRGMDW